MGLKPVPTRGAGHYCEGPPDQVRRDEAIQGAKGRSL